jgi:hypothetical protein
MPANTAPIFALLPLVSWVSGASALAATPGVTANTTMDLTSGTIYGPIAIGNTNGTRIDYLRLRALQANVVTVCRVWINNGSATATAANNALFTEFTCPVTAAAPAAALAEVTIPMNV